MESTLGAYSSYNLREIFTSDTSLIAFLERLRDLDPFPKALYTLMLFTVGGLCEIGGGWLVWQFVRAEKPYWYAVLGGLLLVLYGFVATLQVLQFSTTYASYGGYFIVLSLLWGWLLDHQVPQKQDYIGAGIQKFALLELRSLPLFHEMVDAFRQDRHECTDVPVLQLLSG